MKHLKLYESLELNDVPVKGEYILFNFNNIPWSRILILMRIEVEPMASSAHKNSVFSYTYDVIDRLHSDIYYNTKNKTFFLGNGVKCKVLWRGNNKEEAIEQYEAILAANKYNL